MRIILALVIFSLGMRTPLSVSAQDIPTDLGDAADTDQSDNEIQFIGCNPQNFPVTNSEYEQRVIELVNAERVSRSLAPLKYNETLSNAARYHAVDMMQDNYFDHNSFDVQSGSLVQVCAWSTRVDKFYLNRSWIGENLAAGYYTPEAAVEGWMNSDGHRANILSPNYREMGVGYASGGGRYNYYWGQDFGSRSTVYPVIINNEQGQTSSPDVTLYVYGAGIWDQMRIRNDSDAWSPWRPFQTKFNWLLNSIAGERTVTIELRRSGEEMVVSSSDTINMVNATPHLDVSPQELVFIYNQAENRLSPAQYNLAPVNSNSSTSISWQASASASWITLDRTSGQTPNGIVSVRLDNTNFGNPGVYTGNVTFSANSPAETENSPLSIPVRLIVVTDLPNKIYLPTVTR